ncbi:DCC1-like thiol-disulfide oxidoreductase family protein [Streptomyces sp. NPDC046977]|uniref:thiol-disulfide oxidoreductase DCC family protein n=1 Tax=Streptomyces sp. NPDC046977 TaxID=3154703 RepID=UPI003405A7B0
MDRTPATGAATAAPVPVRRLTVLYDPDCGLCSFVRGWLSRQRQLVPLETVPAASDEARRRFPRLDHASTLREITVIGDSGQVYRGDAAWLVCLWALSEYRPTAHRLSTRSGAPLARAAVLMAARYRESQWNRGAAAAGPGWGGRVYGTADGWTYDTHGGWTYTGTAAGPDSPAPAAPGACAGGCAPPG